MPPKSTDERWMRLALSLGNRGLGSVWPNPAVGCILVQNERVVGRGWTQPGGRPHAEAMALEQAGKTACGATAYVTLEPCAHTGKTPPCANALVDAGVKRVVIALGDPDPRVNGRGTQILEKAGIKVCQNVLKPEAKEAQAGFLTRINTNRPLVTLKIATSIDGRIATHTGDSRWITGPAARREVHRIRASQDAILIGSGTALADDPDLTVRGLGLADRSPIRVLLDRKMRVPSTSRLWVGAGQTPLWVFHNDTSPDAKPQNQSHQGVTFIPCGEVDGKLDVHFVMNSLAERGITRLLCEGGGQIAAALLRADLIDRIVAFGGGVAIGGDGIAALASLGVSQLVNAPRFTQISTRKIGDDTVTNWRRSRAGNVSNAS